MVVVAAAVGGGGDDRRGPAADWWARGALMVDWIFFLQNSLSRAI
jgi:hypothetical protein